MKLNNVGAAETTVRTRVGLLEPCAYTDVAEVVAAWLELRFVTNYIKTNATDLLGMAQFN